MIQQQNLVLIHLIILIGQFTILFFQNLYWVTKYYVVCTVLKMSMASVADDKAIKTQRNTIIFI